MQGQLIGEYGSDGSAIQETIYLGNMPVATIKQGNLYYIHTDQLNTPRAVSDASNTTLWQWESTPFGETAANEDVDGDGISFGYGLRFPGQYFDEETNLHYNYFRDYDPSTGRYVQSDPIGVTRDYSDPRLQVAIETGVLEETGFAGEELNHLYGYVGGNPLFWFDPYGLEKNKNKEKPANPNRNPNKKKGGGSGTGTKKGDAGRERNQGIDEEHSRRPKGGPKIPRIPGLRGIFCPTCLILDQIPQELPPPPSC